MSQRRLLIAGGGTGGFEPPPPPDNPYETFGATSPPEGGWVWFGSPRAVRDGDTTVFGYIRDGGDVRLAIMDNDTRTVTSTAMLYDNFLDDDHEPPSVLIRGDGKIAAALAYHVGDLYYGVGDAVGELPDQFDLTNITSQVGDAEQGVFGYTYASLVYLDDEDRYYIFARWHDEDGRAHVVFTYSDDDGATWEPQTVVADIVYHQVVKNGTDRLDLVMSDHPLYGQDDVEGEPVIIQHAYYDGTWHGSDGTGLTLPIANTGEATTVYDGSPDTSWLWDIAIDGSGRPVITFQVQGDPFPDGPWHYGYARWNGSAWVVNPNVADAGGSIDPGAAPEHGSTTYSGGIVIDHMDTDVVWYSSNAAAGDFQMYRAVTDDGGATWTAVALTADGNKNLRPVSVRGHDGRVAALYLFGTYTDYFDYSQGVRGIGLEP